MTSVVFYDGVCGLCNRFVRFLLRRDREGRLLFAPLQGELADTTLSAHGADPTRLDAMYVLVDRGSPSAHVLSGSDAVIHTLAQLGGPWPAVAKTASLLPSPIANALYRIVARLRYPVFGRLTSCPLPPPEWRRHFLE